MFSTGHGIKVSLLTNKNFNKLEKYYKSVPNAKLLPTCFTKKKFKCISFNDIDKTIDDYLSRWIKVSKFINIPNKLKLNYDLLNLQGIKKEYILEYVKSWYDKDVCIPEQLFVFGIFSSVGYKINELLLLLIPYAENCQIEDNSTNIQYKSIKNKIKDNNNVLKNDSLVNLKNIRKLNAIDVYTENELKNHISNTNSNPNIFTFNIVNNIQLTSETNYGSALVLINAKANIIGKGSNKIELKGQGVNNKYGIFYIEDSIVNLENLKITNGYSPVKSFILI